VLEGQSFISCPALFIYPFPSNILPCGLYDLGRLIGISLTYHHRPLHSPARPTRHYNHTAQRNRPGVDSLKEKEKKEKETAEKKDRKKSGKLKDKCLGVEQPW
jgi:hypothetical protein